MKVTVISRSDIFMAQNLLKDVLGYIDCNAVVNARANVKTVLDQIKRLKYVEIEDGPNPNGDR